MLLVTVRRYFIIGFIVVLTFAGCRTSTNEEKITSDKLVDI